MSLFEFRYLIESAIPWWVPFAVAGGLLLAIMSIPRRK